MSFGGSLHHVAWVEASCYGGQLCCKGELAFSGHPNSEFNAWITRRNWISGKASSEREKKPTDKLAASSDRIAVVRIWQSVVTPSPVTVKKSSTEEYCGACQQSHFLCLWELRSAYLPCVYPSKRTLNEINKFRLNWQLVSKVIILPLMSPHWNGRRLGLNGNTAGCGTAVYSNTKKWRAMAARVYLSRFLNTHTHMLMQRSHLLTSSSLNRVSLTPVHTTPNLARDKSLHSLPMSPSVASQQKDPRLCWLRLRLPRLRACLGPPSQ